MLIIKIQNDSTGTNESANYKYQVLVNQTAIESGEIRGHNRDDGWRKLVKQLVDESEKLYADFM